MARYDNLDWARIGQNVRRMRIGQGTSQDELARRANVSTATIYNVERCAPVSRRTLQSIAEALGEPIDSLRTRHQSVLADDQECVVFRQANAAWIVCGERRTWIPEDDVFRIQNEEERQRLGNLGFVPAFVHTTSFLMPEGPGLVNFELYGHFADPFNATIYRDCLINCVSDSVRLLIRDRTVVLAAGDVVGYRTKDLQWMEPVEGSQLPVRFTWIGGMRIGPPLRELGKGERVKRRRTHDENYQPNER